MSAPLDRNIYIFMRSTFTMLPQGQGSRAHLLTNQRRAAPRRRPEPRTGVTSERRFEVHVTLFGLWPVGGVSLNEIVYISAARGHCDQFKVYLKSFDQRPRARILSSNTDQPISSQHSRPLHGYGGGRQLGHVVCGGRKRINGT